MTKYKHRKSNYLPKGSHWEGGEELANQRGGNGSPRGGKGEDL